MSCARDEERSRDEPEHACCLWTVLQAAHELQAPDEERSRYEPERAALPVGLPQAARELQAPDEKRSRYEPGARRCFVLRRRIFVRTRCRRFCLSRLIFSRLVLSGLSFGCLIPGDLFSVAAAPLAVVTPLPVNSPGLEVAAIGVCMIHRRQKLVVLAGGC